MRVKNEVSVPLLFSFSSYRGGRGKESSTLERNLNSPLSFMYKGFFQEYDNNIFFAQLGTLELPDYDKMLIWGHMLKKYVFSFWSYAQVMSR